MTSLIVFIFPFTFHCPHDFHELIVFTFIVLMIYSKTFKFIFGGIGHIVSSSNHELRF
jgi:hypothetical protein